MPSAVIFDMDGVVLNTVELHFRAWKKTFDHWLRKQAKLHLQKPKLFSWEDYLYYVDGVSRQEGIKNFLNARHLTISEAVVTKLAKKKNSYFLKSIQQQKVLSFASSIEFIKALRKQGIKTALISASKNCQQLVSLAGIASCFDLVVDGIFVEQQHLATKPAPDIFLALARQLNIKPQNIAVVEDAYSGIKAAKAGQFGLIIGIDRKKLGAQIFKEWGADIVVEDLSEIKLKGLIHWFNYLIPPIFTEANEINPEAQAIMQGKKPVLFLDYDGTLTPIVKQPQTATLSVDMKSYLKKLSQHFTVAVISGRELTDLKARVGLEGLYYAGNHGFEMVGPNLNYHIGTEYLQEIAEIYQTLRQKLQGINGIYLENKKFTLSVHYREVPEAEMCCIHKILSEIFAQHPNFKRREGKKVFEIRPNLNWDKGKAILWLLEKLNLKQTNSLPIYIGDDATDEDAFLALKKIGMGIIVTDIKQPTKAKFGLRNIAEVERFFSLLLRQQHHGILAFNL